jgi:hypothetical protein
MAEKDCSSVSAGPSTVDVVTGELVALARAPEGGAPGASAPPPFTNRGVEFCIHALTVTLWADALRVASVACELLGIGGGVENFTALQHGGRSFRSLLIGPGGLKLYVLPTNGGAYCSLEIPGEVSKSIPWDRLQAVFHALNCRVQWTRVDLAFDTLGFEPASVYETIMAGEVRSLAKRQTLRRITQPLSGGDTVYLGARTSERMLRVYLHAGPFTRVELECKGERANLIMGDLLATEPGQWARRALGHLRDFIDFKRDWWAEFCQGAERAHMKLTSWAASSFGRTQKWLEKQVAPALALVEELIGIRELFELADRGRMKWGPRHLALLAAYGVAT